MSQLMVLAPSEKFVMLPSYLIMQLFDYLRSKFPYVDFEIIPRVTYRDPAAEAIALKRTDIGALM
jgi:hypothetical protein